MHEASRRLYLRKTSSESEIRQKVTKSVENIDLMMESQTLSLCCIAVAYRYIRQRERSHCDEPYRTVLNRGTSVPSCRGRAQTKTAEAYRDTEFGPRVFAVVQRCSSNSVYPATTSIFEMKTQFLFVSLQAAWC